MKVKWRRRYQKEDKKEVKCLRMIERKNKCEGRRRMNVMKKRKKNEKVKN